MGIELTSEGFKALFEETLQKQIKVWPARSWAPSQIGHPCDRFLWARFVKWEDAMPHDATLEAIFQEGSLHQPHVYMRLEQMGFQIVRESDRPTQWRPKPGIVISGRIDGKLLGFRQQRYRSPVILEVKSASAHAWDSVDSAEDLRTHRHHWMRGYYGQGQIYMLLEGLEHCVIVMKNKSTGQLKLLPMKLDLAYAETIIQRIERLNPMVTNRIMPDPIPFDRSICGRCPHVYWCQPYQESEGTRVEKDAELLEAILEKEAHDAARRTWESADKRVKRAMDRLVDEDGEQIIIDGGEGGRYLATLKLVAVKEHTVPAGVQRRLTIERIDDATEAPPPEPEP